MADVLAFSPHPDDAEIGCGATLAKLVAQGHQVAIIDLSRGELGSLGSPEIREQESHQAAAALGISIRENLNLPDGRIDSHDRSQQQRVVAALRKYCPKVVFLPMDDGRHPDHREACLLVRDSLFLSGLKNFLLPDGSPHFDRPQAIEYPTRNVPTPSFVVDVTAHYKKKLAAIQAYSSQLKPSGGAQANVLISSALTLPAIESRDTLWGAMVGVSKAEGFVVHSPLKLEDPVAYFQSSPLSGALLFPEL